MTENHAKDDSKSDDGEESDRELKATAKAYALLVYAYLRAGVGRILDEFAKAADEIAPQLTGALSGVSVPARAWKPLGLAAVLLIAAVAIPAAPLGDDPSASVETQEPVEGETFETETEPETDSETSTEPERSTLNGATLNELPSSFLGGSPDAPEPPEQVRASAGSQTMSVETAVVDGEPAIVLEDDRTHDGRWVSIETAWFEQQLGEIPNAAYVTHEDGSRYAAALNVRGDSAAFYVREFSTNTVTFDGEVTLSGEEAGDGTEFQYDLNATDVGAPSINLTGVETTQADSVSARRTDGESFGFSVGGGSAPRDETVTLTGIEETTPRSLSPGTVSNGYSQSFDVAGNQPARDDTVTLTGVETTTPGSVDPGVVSDGYSTGINVGGNQPARDDSVTFTGVETTTPGSVDPGVVSDSYSTTINVGGNQPARDDSVTLTGTETTSSDSFDWGTVNNGYLTALSVGGNIPARDASVSFTGVRSENGQIKSGSLSSPGSNSISIGGNTDPTGPAGGSPQVSISGNPVIDGVTSTSFEAAFGLEDNSAGFGNTKTIDVSGIDRINYIRHSCVTTGGSNGGSVTFRIDGTEVYDANLVNFEIRDEAGGTKTTVDVSGQDTATLDFVSSDGVSELSCDGRQGSDDIGAFEVADQPTQISVNANNGGSASLGTGGTSGISLSPSTDSLSFDYVGGGSISYDLDYTEISRTENPTVSIGGSTASYSGVLSDGQTVTRSIELSPGSPTADVSVSGPVGVSGSWTEVTATKDPAVTVDGMTVSYSGVLGDGQTTTKSVDLSPGSHTFDVSTGGSVGVASSWTEVTATEDPSITVDGQTVSHTGVLNDGETTTKSLDLTPGSKSLDVSTSGEVDIAASWTAVTATEDPSITVDGQTVSHTGVLNNGETTTKSLDLSPGSKTLDVSTSGEVNVDASWTEVTATEDPSVSVGGSTVSHTGILGDGQTVSRSIDLSTGSQTGTVSVNGPVDVNTSWTEVTETQDPTVTVNGEQVGLDGTLADGETATLDASASWLQSGTNYVTVSTNSPASGPASLVTLDYSHGAETATEAAVEETTWSQTTTVANTWASARSNASVTVPMNDRVVDVRSVEVRRNGTTWDPLAADRYELNGTDLTAELGDIAEGSMVEVRATGSKVRVRDGSITVLEPTMSSDQLDTRVRIDDAGPNFALSVDETVFSDRVHYADNSTWGPQTGATTITAQGDQTLAIPNATVGAQTTVRTWPVEVAPVTGQATVTDLAGDRSEPGITVRGDGNSDVDYTFTGAADGRPYILWSQTNEIVRDEGLASSPITLTDDNSDETLVFLVDDGSASSSGPGDGPTGSVGGGGAGGGPMAGAGGSVLAQLRGIAPSGQTLLLGVTLLGGLFVVGRRTGVITEDRQQAATSAAGSAASTVGGLVERAIANEIVFGVLLLAGGGWLLASGVLPEQTTLIVSLSAVPVAMFLVLQQFDRFDFRIWAGSTALVGVLGLQVLAPELFETIADEAGVIIVAGVLALAWRAVSAWRAEANTPDEVNRIEITDDDGEN